VVAASKNKAKMDRSRGIVNLIKFHDLETNTSKRRDHCGPVSKKQASQREFHDGIGFDVPQRRVIQRVFSGMPYDDPPTGRYVKLNRRSCIQEAGIMAETFILIPGRTSKQGCGISEGKFEENYQSEITTLQVNPDDMERLGLKKGGRVTLKSETGLIEIKVIAATPGELPQGMLFMAYGDLSSRLMGGETHGSGMPTSKGIDVELEVISSG
jgi:formylmethanofuran dehydrogenase subunit D